MTPFRCLAVALAALVAACAAPDPEATGTTTTREPLEYRTGSNIPIRSTRPKSTPTPAEEPRHDGDAARSTN
jgi:type IV pilus biogenesis protein CpaD/CtpE